MFVCLLVFIVFAMKIAEDTDVALNKNILRNIFHTIIQSFKYAYLLLKKTVLLNIFIETMVTFFQKNGIYLKYFVTL